MKNADREDEIEESIEQWQIEQVGLDDAYVGQPRDREAAFSTAALRSTPTTRAPWLPTRRE